MMQNKAVSVRNRLKNIARTENSDFQRILNNYAIQKLLVQIAKVLFEKNYY